MTVQIGLVMQPREEQNVKPTGPDEAEIITETFDGSIEVMTWDAFNNRTVYQATIPYESSDTVVLDSSEWSELALEKLESWADHNDYDICDN